MTKEELLEKGVSEEVADEIISAFDEQSSSENSLEQLEKALSPEAQESSLFKADDPEEDEEDDYNEEYMKKYMKKYMKENKSACTKAAKELGLFGGEMKKAIDNFDTDVEGAVVEMAELAPILEKQGEFNEKMAKAIEYIAGQVSLIVDENSKSFDIMQKAARVQIEQAKAMDSFLGQPTGRKGVTATAMAKASEVATDPNHSALVYNVLMKAVKSGDVQAGGVISLFESAGQNINALTDDQKRYVSDLLSKEAN